MKQRPLGVTIYAGLFIIGALTPLSVLIMVSLRMIQEQLKTSDDVSLGIGFLVTSGAFVLYLLGVGIGLFFLKRWARWLALLSALVSSVWIGYVDVTMLSRASLKGLAVVNSLLVFCWNGVMFWYFLRPSVKAQFVSKGR